MGQFVSMDKNVSDPFLDIDAMKTESSFGGPFEKRILLAVVSK